MLKNTNYFRINQKTIGDTKLDTVFDQYLKPLRSKNARLIFKIFIAHGQKCSLTTLDIETELLKIGLNLDKKEINGYLVSLLKSGLILKDERRGKPTIIKYDEKYTFDLWKITDLGIEIADWIQKFTDKGSLNKEEDIYAFLNQIFFLDKINKDIRIQKIKEEYAVIKCLETLSENNNITNIDLKERLNFDLNEINEILLKYSRNDSTKPAIFKVIPVKGLINRFKKLFERSNLYYCRLSEYSEKLAKNRNLE